MEADESSLQELASPAAEAASYSRETRNLAALAAISVQSGTTRYDLPAAVSIPDKSSTMVMLADQRIPGQVVALYAPDGGVPDSARHPFRVARFVNKTGGLVERGPLAIFADGAFAGQGVTDALPDGATATVPFGAGSARRRRGLARVARRGVAPLPHRGRRADRLARRGLADDVQAAQRRRRARHAADQAPAQRRARA